MNNLQAFFRNFVPFSSEFFRTTHPKPARMEQSKAIQMLKRIPEAELDQFRDFAASPIFNKDPILLSMVNLLLADFPKIPTEEALIKDLFPSKAVVSLSRMDRLKNKLVLLIGEYIDFRGRYRVADEDRHVVSRIAELYDRGEQRAFEKETSRLEKQLSSGKQLSVEQFYTRYQLWNLTAETQPVFTGHRADEIRGAFRLLQQYESVASLRLLCAVANLSRIRSQVELPVWARKAIDALPAIHSDSPPLYLLYRFCLNLQLSPYSQAHYDGFLALLMEHAESLSQKEGHDLFQYAINFQIRRFNQDQNNLEAAREIAFLYQNLLDNGFLYENGQISPWNYKNIATLMGRIGQLDWLEGFMDACEGRIHNDLRENAANFGRGLLAFYRENYLETVRRMDAILTNFRDVFWGLEARALLLQAHYQRGSHDLLEAAYHQARMYTGRAAKDKVGSPHEESYRQFFHIVYRLSVAVNGDPGKRPAKLDKLQEKIQGIRFLANSSWLLSKIAEART
jgi:hypothetical protein